MGDLRDLADKSFRIDYPPQIFYCVYFVSGGVNIVFAIQSVMFVVMQPNFPISSISNVSLIHRVGCRYIRFGWITDVLLFGGLLPHVVEAIQSIDM